MNVTRRQLFGWSAAGAAAVAGGVYALDRKGWLDFFDADASEKNPAQVMRRPYSPEPGRELSILGFGCMRFPILEQNRAKIDEELSLKMVDYAYRHGVNYFDTAEMYMGGNSQAFVGKALERYPRESLYIVTKMPGFAPFVKTLDDAKKLFQRQLDKCRTTYFDNYLLHTLKDPEPFKELYIKNGVLDYLLSERERGRIRHLGFSFHGTTEHLKYYLSLPHWEFCMLMLNCLDWNEKDEAISAVGEHLGFRWGFGAQPCGTHYRMATEAGLPVMVMEPLRGGRLVTLNKKTVRQLKAIEPKLSIASWGLRFVASLPNVSVTLSGMSRMSDVVDNISTMANFKPLEGSARSALLTAIDDFRRQKTISCTTCRYCMPCSYGVDIPGVFTAFNDAAGEGELGENADGAGVSKELQRKFLVNYHNALAPRTDASRCIGCRKCESACPQSLKIAELMSKINRMTASFRHSGKKEAHHA